jgi:hypothetical protein
LIRQEKVLPKLYFNAKSQEIRLMSPLPSHGKRVEAYIPVQIPELALSYLEQF